MRHHHFISILCLLLLLSAVFSCLKEDGLLQSVFSGEAEVELAIDYRPLESAGTKSSGTLYRTIDNLNVFFYDAADGKLIVHKYLTPSDYSLDLHEVSGYAESSYWKASFKLTVPRGRYRIYALANWDSSMSSELCETEAALKSERIEWQTSEGNKAGEGNDKMLGFFTSDNNVVESAPVVEVSSEGLSLHAWLRRCVSKVTVSFDGSQLAENVYIYLKSVQIKDIPLSCSLGDDNSPSSLSELQHEGETLMIGNGDDFTSWPRITKGSPRYGSHSEDAEAMYFFENMQGSGEKHGYHPGDSSWDKDRKSFGTYIEVKGYYINRSDYNASVGDITYRFMLGKDVETDFNAQRNNHYKVTICFRADANDPDWHIEYDPVDPELKVPGLIYISYGYNKRSDITAAVIGGTSSTVSVRIASNPWWYDGHKLANYPENRSDSNGFLNLEPSSAVEISSSDRKNGYVSSRTYNAVEQDAVDKYVIPIYTRPLVMGSSYSGYNYYEHHHKMSNVEVTAQVRVAGGAIKTITKTVHVIQVRRLLNPGGVWRRSSHDTPFKVILSAMPDEEQDYQPLESEGPWTARIVQGADWVRIKSCDSSTWGTEQVNGSTGSVIQFDYKPSGTIGENDVRCGIIEVLYHNNKCSHYVFVRQGYAPLQMGSYRWHSYNMWHYRKECTSPCSEGCMFKFGNEWKPIKPQVNFKDGYRFNQSVPADWTFTQDNGVEKKWTDSDFQTGTNFDNLYPSDGCHVAQYYHWQNLADNCERAYGVLYADGSTQTKMKLSDVYEYLFDESTGGADDADKVDKGMRGVFMYHADGRNLFLPIGATGYGHRQKDNYIGSLSGTHRYAVLKYAQSAEELPAYNSDGSTRAVTIPMYYDLYRQNGAVYWYRYDRAPNSLYCAWDINFTTCGFADFLGNAFTGYYYGNLSTGNDSNLALVRCVDD